jgi:hypothetical protein
MLAIPGGILAATLLLVLGLGAYLGWVLHHVLAYLPIDLVEQEDPDDDDHYGEDEGSGDTYMPVAGPRHPHRSYR